MLNYKHFETKDACFVAKRCNFAARHSIISNTNTNTRQYENQGKRTY